MDAYYGDILIKSAIIIAIGIALSLAVYFVAPPGDAIEIHQGEDVYLGETADIALALAWPDFTIAWCKNGYEGCIPPDQLIQVTGFMHKYYIDPEVFHPGWYYRWDGRWNSGENQQAFRVRVGTRPEINLTPTPIPTPTPAPGVDSRGNGPFSWIIARGDSPDISFHYSTEDVCGTGPGNDTAHVWLFGGSDVITDKELWQTKNDYEYSLTSADTATLSNGKYSGYIQFPGVNGRQDVFYDPISKCLDTPYDDAIYPDVVVDKRFPSSFKTLFEKVATDMKYSDDLLVPVTMFIVEPSIRITDITQGQDKLFIGGKTTWSNGTIITIRLDPDNYALASDKRSHTWEVPVVGDITTERTFSTSVPIEMKDMYIGTHELKMTVDKNNYISDVYHDFKITGTYVMPTPTPEFRKFITDMNGTQIISAPTVVVTEATPEPTVNPQVTTVVINITPVETVVENLSETNETETITPTTKPTPTPTHDRNIVVPLPWWLAFVAVFAYWRLK